VSSTENSHDSPRRRRSPLAIASVAAAVLVVGGGGAYLATAGFGGGDSGGADGQVVGGSGQLKKPEKSHDYPVISAEEALKQLNKAGESSGRIGIGGCAAPVPLGGEQQPAAPCEPDGGKAAGPERLTISKAVFGPAARYVDGQQALVPSWLFAVEPKDGAEPFTITHPAIDPEFLKESAPPGKDVTPTEPTEPTEDPAEPSKRRVTSYSVNGGDGGDGHTLTLTFWGGVCSDYAAKASEGADRVKVRITETNPDPDRVCVLIAKELTEKVTLDKPLGDRKVVDAETGEAVPLTK
jgi:hypothetical protein